MATRRRSDRAARDRAQDRGPKTIGDQPQQESPIQAQAGHAAAQTQDVTIERKTLAREEVAQRAYDLYQQRGRGDGADLDDWLQAERDLQRQG